MPPSVIGGCQVCDDTVALPKAGDIAAVCPKCYKMLATVFGGQQMLPQHVSWGRGYLRGLSINDAYQKLMGLLEVPAPEPWVSVTINE